jgi:K+-transporting ATPase c subunit
VCRSNGQAVIRQAQLAFSRQANACLIVQKGQVVGSGLDPNISVAAALYQLPRVARLRGLSEAAVRSLVDQSTQGRTVGFLGEVRVNVLELNLSLDKIKK